MSGYSSDRHNSHSRRRQSTHNYDQQQLQQQNFTAYGYSDGFDYGEGGASAPPVQYGSNPDGSYYIAQSQGQPQTQASTQGYPMYDYNTIPYDQGIYTSFQHIAAPQSPQGNGRPLSELGSPYTVTSSNCGSPIDARRPSIGSQAIGGSREANVSPTSPSGYGAMTSYNQSMSMSEGAVPGPRYGSEQWQQTESGKSVAETVHSHLNESGADYANRMKGRGCDIVRDLRLSIDHAQTANSVLDDWLEEYERDK